jgi:hypothetical protein
VISILAIRCLRRALIGVLLLSNGPVVAQTTIDVFPSQPLDEAVVQARPVFQLGYTGLEDDDLRKTRFRIILEPRDDGGPTYSFDQRRRRSGWSAGGPGQMIYRPKRPLVDGSYEWVVAVWDGTAWREGGRRFRLRVDSVPPAPVENLTIRYDSERGLVELEWDPVALDVDGGAEYVALYHVYRYPRADRTPSVEPFEVAESEQPRVTLEVDPAGDAKLWFYRVTAEDLAGNEAGRPD